MKKAKNKNSEFCQVVYCRNLRAKSRKICNKCRTADYVKRNRPLVVWHWIKKSAKRRNIIFNLSKLYFYKFLSDSGYISGSGRLGDSLTIDRIKPELGYVNGNLQVITRVNNIKKYHEEEKQYPF